MNSCVLEPVLKPTREGILKSVSIALNVMNSCVLEPVLKPTTLW